MSGALGAPTLATSGWAPPGAGVAPSFGLGGSLPLVPTIAAEAAHPGLRPMAPARPMSAVEFELWVAVFFVLLIVGGFLMKKKLLPDHMFSVYETEWWPHMDPTFLPMFIMTLCQHNTAFLNRNILYPFSLLVMMTGGQ